MMMYYDIILISIFIIFMTITTVAGSFLAPKLRTDVVCLASNTTPSTRIIIRSGCCTFVVGAVSYNIRYCCGNFLSLLFCWPPSHKNQTQENLDQHLLIDLSTKVPHTCAMLNKVTMITRKSEVQNEN